MARILSILLLQFNQLKETHDLFKKTYTFNEIEVRLF